MGMVLGTEWKDRAGLWGGRCRDDVKVRCIEA
jgi:hypothetical protein